MMSRQLRENKPTIISHIPQIQGRMTITDAILLRSNEITELLAGCVAMDTFYTLKQIERINDISLTHVKARDFILGMRSRLPELQASDEKRIVEIIMEVVQDLGCIWDYAYWIGLPSDIKTEVKNAIKELQGLAICLNVINNLQGWLTETEAWIERRL